MKIAYIAAGAGGMYCGNCLHDNTLATAMLREGQDVLLVPTYTPLKTDEENVSVKRVFFGGLNVYLDQKYPWFRRLPRWATGWLNRPWLLNWVTQLSVSTKAEDLGGLAVSMLRGEEGFQKREIDELVDWLAREVQPDIVHLSNVLLVGMARTLRERLGVPVITTLGGEDLFLEQLKEPHTSQALNELRARIADLSGLVALNRYYADRCRGLWDIPEDKLFVVPHGLSFAGHGTRGQRGESDPFTLGYFGRIVPEKGVELLVQAFIQLAQREDLPPLRLRLAGYLAPSDKKYLARIEALLRAAGLVDRYEYQGSPDRAGKIAFLQQLDCLAMPCIYPESKGLPILEALANAVPVVVPRSGAFPEAIEQTGGGLLCEPGDVESLTEALAQLITDPPLAEKLRIEGQQAVRERFSDTLMAQRTIQLYQAILSRSASADQAASASTASREPTDQAAGLTTAARTQPDAEAARR